MRRLELSVLTALLLWVMLGGCGSMATRKAFYEPIRAELVNGEASKAVAMLEAVRQKEFGEKDRLIYFLDAGLLNHYAGEYATSSLKLALVDQAAEELFTKSISKAALSVVLNDNALDYAGEDFEILYANLISALNYMALDEIENGFVEIRQANLNLELLEQKYAEAVATLREGASADTTEVYHDYELDEIRFHNDAFARYLSMHLYAAEGKYDDARIDRDLLLEAFATQSHIYDFEPPDVNYFSADKVILSVVGLVGLAPTKSPLALRLRTDKDLNLIQILYDGPGHGDEEYTHLPWPVGEDYYFKFSIPVMVSRPSQVARIEVRADSVLLGELSLIEDVSKVAIETFKTRKSLIFLRTVVRAVAKGLAAHKLKEKADDGGLGGWLLKAAIDVGTDLSENADTRSSQFLPGRILVGDFEIEPGHYDLTLLFYDQAGEELVRIEYPGYEVLERGINLIEGIALR